MRYLHTSKRMHFIEDARNFDALNAKGRLHTSKRMHFIEDYGALLVSEKPDMLAYVKTYALH